MSARLRAIASETIAIIEEGGYRTDGGAWVDLAGSIAAAVDGTRLYLPGDPAIAVGSPGTRADKPTIEVTNSSTLAASRQLGGDVACLVFASAKNRGGGFLNGAQAQEESIARSSALYACLTAAPDFYAYHRAQDDLRYSDRVIYSPAVPVFRDDRGRLLDEPYRVTMLTAAAPNLGAIQLNQPELADSVPDALRQRAVRVLQVAAAGGHRRLVLGAWGCGVFRNDPVLVARAFVDALRVVDYFDHVVFAVLDRVAGTPVHKAFARSSGGNG